MAGTKGITIGDGPASVPGVRSRAFSKAQRHSRLVRFAKVAIPVGALIAAVGVGAVAYLDPFRKIEGLSVGPISVSGTNVTMESPKLTGFRNDNRPYEVTASAATQDVKNPNLVELKDLRARLITDDKGSTARLEAAVGILNTQKEQMNLRQDVRVHTDGGQKVLLRSAFGYLPMAFVLAGAAIVGTDLLITITDDLSAMVTRGLGDRSGGDAHFIDTLGPAGVAAVVDGIFMEVHENPARALSDGPNAYRLARLPALLRRLLRVKAAAGS